MISYSEWLQKKITEAGTGMAGCSPDTSNVQGMVQGAPSHGRLASVGDVKTKKNKMKKRMKK